MLTHYENASGQPVDRGAVHWWNVFAAYKTAVMQASGLRAFREGRSEEHYKPTAPVLKAVLHAALGRSVQSGPAERMGPPATERDAFLAWDTSQILTLLGLGTQTSPRDTVGANDAARASLAEFIGGLTFDKRDDELRSQIGGHLLQRVSMDPALARRPV